MLIEEIFYCLTGDQSLRVARLEYVALRYARTRTVETGAAEVAAIANGDHTLLNCAATALVITNATRPEAEQPYALAAAIIFRAGACTVTVGRALERYAKAHPTVAPCQKNRKRTPYSQNRTGIASWLARKQDPKSPAQQRAHEGLSGPFVKTDGGPTSKGSTHPRTLRC